jgi:hypothetical protein
MFGIKIIQGSNLEKKIETINTFIRTQHKKKKVTRLCVTVMVKSSDSVTDCKEFWIGKEMGLSGAAKTAPMIRTKI